MNNIIYAPSPVGDRKARLTPLAPQRDEHVRGAVQRIIEPAPPPVEAVVFVQGKTLFVSVDGVSKVFDISDLFRSDAAAPTLTYTPDLDEGVRMLNRRERQ